MKIFKLYISLFSFATFSYALSNDGASYKLDTTEVDDAVIENHEIGDWAKKTNTLRNMELSNAVVDGLSSTTIKAHLVVKPKSSVLDIVFYNYFTEFVRKNFLKMKSVRLANIIIHYQPYSDECQGVVSYALVDTRFANNKMDVEPHAMGTKAKEITGKVKHLVTVECSREAFIQFSMVHSVATDDISKLKLCQIVSGVDMVKGNLAKVNIGWFTVPSDNTIYQPFPAQLYYFPKLALPELRGKTPEQTFKKFVDMAKRKHDNDVMMLEGLQKIVDGQVVMNNNLGTNIADDITKAQTDVDKLQHDIDTITKAIPEKHKLDELNLKRAKLLKFKENAMKELLAKRDALTVDDESYEGLNVEINDNSDNKSVNLSHLNMD